MREKSKNVLVSKGRPSFNAGLTVSYRTDGASSAVAFSSSRLACPVPQRLRKATVFADLCSSLRISVEIAVPTLIPTLCSVVNTLPSGSPVGVSPPLRVSPFRQSILMVSTRIIHEDTLEVMFGVFFGVKRSVVISFGVFGKPDLRIS